MVCYRNYLIIEIEYVEKIDGGKCNLLVRSFAKDYKTEELIPE